MSLLMEAVEAWRQYGIRAWVAGPNISRDFFVSVEPELFVRVVPPWAREEGRLVRELTCSIKASDHGKDGIPIAMEKRNGEWIVAVRLDDFINIGRTSWRERRNFGS